MECLITVSILPAIGLGLIVVYLIIGVIFSVRTFSGGMWETAPSVPEMMALYVLATIFWPIGIIRGYF